MSKALTTNKTLMLGGLALAAVVLVYFLFFKNKSSKAVAEAMPAINSDDEAVFQQLTKLFEQHMGEPVPSWLMQSAKDYYDGVHANTFNNAYKVGGQITKSGSFMHAFATDYYKGSNTVKSGSGRSGGTSAGNSKHQPLNEAMWRVFDPFRSRNTF